MTLDESKGGKLPAGFKPSTELSSELITSPRGQAIGSPRTCRSPLAVWVQIARSCGVGFRLARTLA